VLRAAFTEDRERLVRFEREAKLLASLNHPTSPTYTEFESPTLEDGSTVHIVSTELALAKISSSG
jgi:serine/threonine protein kinase